MTRAEMSSDDEDTPLSQTISRKNQRVRKIVPEEDSDYDSDDVLSKQPKKKKTKTLSKEKKIKVKSDSDDDDDEVMSKKLEKKKKKKKTKTIKKSIKKEKETENDLKEEENNDDEEEDKEESYKWWEEGDVKDNGWTSLVHNGVMFPPEYEPLPSHIKLYYDNQPVELPPEAEEVAGFYAALLETDHGKNPVFQKNFFNDFLQILKENGGTLNGIEIKSFDKCDFSKIYNYFEVLKEEKKKLSAQEKKELRLERQKEEEIYKFCELNGRKEQVGNFRVEPPDLFRGRGKHPKTGKLKRRVHPEDIVLNLSKDAPIPKPPKGHKWGEIRHDPNVQWLAMWRENIFNSFKYVRLAANSSLKGQSDLKKFEKARELKSHIDSIRRDYKRSLKSKVMLERQKAVAIYLIDVFALRAGGEKSEDEADTVGCCSLRYEHVTLQPPNIVIFDFLGKDSIRFYQEVEVDKQVFKDLIIFKRPPKQPGHQLFDRLDPSILNKHLQSYMPGLTAKVFRTYNASKTMQDQLDLIPNEGSVAEKLLRYNAANRTVAILCNHQRSVTKGHAQSVQKANFRIKELIWQRIRLKKSILQLDKKLRKKNPKFYAEIDDLTKEDEIEIHEKIIERENEKYQRKFVRENDKRKFENEELLEEKVLNEWLEKVEDLKKEFAEEIKTGEIVLKPTLNTVEKLEKQIERLDLRIETSSIQLKDKEENSEVSLGTSKINYIDPRLSVVFCKKFGVPIEKIFTKSLREKFTWAIESVDENWRF
ncbi:similar to Saccharomyces cerevisiae YOL006C TOP1 Topoisomerase I, nuclear enzyme that relieves torsional strain in DNA by cleaving and re-sealing the phosphodiester backbone [Maudiozyma saulgeensis]|uniref:DNA topoisomerase I n=1 Tax=Maudiozyma saulgeensis TaxID=1789683 RepID=A0A1X7RBC0_9SACH|nr:similar to Saccharomyces cerevisiae YOL006C TOP1 Topoisomerase I, nuclear enzyme that relieves torsional strain in DNA by cleaving and re-sealing the phosphodiester backbone [Kazachstania saulgeensis]